MVSSWHHWGKMRVVAAVGVGVEKKKKSTEEKLRMGLADGRDSHDFEAVGPRDARETVTNKKMIYPFPLPTPALQIK